VQLGVYSVVGEWLATLIDQILQLVRRWTYF
jgi:hypothetical protein